MIAIIDYEMGNLRSVQKALEKVGAEAVVTQDKITIEQADKIVLPGVGAMQSAMQRLRELDLIDILKLSAHTKPFLGICLGYQLLFEKSDEGGDVQGLGILKGTVKRFSSQVKVPHMGWNTLTITQPKCALFKGMDQALVYFCHSFYVQPDDNIIATTTEYGNAFASSIAKNKLFGVQFHPEKSQTIGLEILKNFNAL